VIVWAGTEVCLASRAAISVSNRAYRREVPPVASRSTFTSSFRRFVAIDPLEFLALSLFRFGGCSWRLGM
jgi:hypothetical protein